MAPLSRKGGILTICKTSARFTPFYFLYGRLAYKCDLLTLGLALGMMRRSLIGVRMLKSLMNLAFCNAACAVPAAQAGVKRVHDVWQREVAVDVPVKRTILTFYYPDDIAV